MKLYRIALSVTLALAATNSTTAQKNNSQSASPPGQTQNQSSGASGTAQGVTWPKSAWESLKDYDTLTKAFPPVSKAKRYLLCYSLDITTGSLSTPPFVFRQVDSIPVMDGPECINTANAKKPMVARGFIGVAIDARHVPIERMHSFNLTFTATSGQPINLYPVRPSASAGSSSSSGGGPQTANGGGGGLAALPRRELGGIYYLLWTQELGGDTIPTVTVSLVYTPPVPGTPWQFNTVYPEGSIVTPGNMTINPCISGGVISGTVTDQSDHGVPNAKVTVTNPAIAFTRTLTTNMSGSFSFSNLPAGRYTVSVLADDSNEYVELGAGGSVQLTMKLTSSGVQDSSSTPRSSPSAQDATAPAESESSGGNSSSGEPAFPSPAVHTIPASLPVFTGHYFVARNGGLSSFNLVPAFCVISINDGGVWWVDSGISAPANASTSPGGQTADKTSTTISNWTPKQTYSQNSVVYSPITGHYYTATQIGTHTSGQSSPFSLKTIPEKNDPNLSWVIIGKQPPPVGPTPQTWAPGNYANGQTVYDPDSQLYFTAMLTDGTKPGTSGPGNPFVDYGTFLSFPDPTTNDVVWLDAGSTAPSLAQQSQAAIPNRAGNSHYGLGAMVFDPPSGHFFTAVSEGVSSLPNQGILKANQPYRIREGTTPDPSPTNILQDFLQIDKNGSYISESFGQWTSLAASSANLPCSNRAPYPFWNEELHVHQNNCVTTGDNNYVFQILFPNDNPDAEYVSAIPRHLKVPPENPLSSILERFRAPNGAPDDYQWKRPKDQDGAYTSCNPTALGSDYEPDFCATTANPSVYLQLSSFSSGPFTAYPQSADFQDVTRRLTILSVSAPNVLKPIEWEDIGTSVPSLVSSGEPADQTVAQAYTLTQVHSLYYFNISTAVVVSSIRSRAFGWATNAPGIYTPIQVSSNPIVDPVVFLTAYWPKHPMDAESPWSKNNLLPAPVLGFSMTSPTSNFYLGLSSEIRRNIQVVFGASTAEPQRLSSTSFSSSNMGTPPTAQKFTMGGFVGISLNISGLIQGAIQGGK